MTDPKSAAEIMYPSQQGDAAPGKWRIELRYLPLFHRGHAFLALVDDRRQTVRELHGPAYSKHTSKPMAMGPDGSDLKVEDYDRRPDGKTDMGPRLNGDMSDIATVASGSREQIEKTWARGVQTGAAINAEKFDYKAHDPAYEFGGRGGEIQNSNSVAFTLGKAMGLDLSAALQAKGTTRTFSGWDRDLLDPKYKRYVAPPAFPVTNAP